MVITVKQAEYKMLSTLIISQQGYLIVIELKCYNKNVTRVQVSVIMTFV